MSRLQASGARVAATHTLWVPGRRGGSAGSRAPPWPARVRSETGGLTKLPTAPITRRALADTAPQPRSAPSARAGTKRLPPEAHAFRRRHGDPVGWDSGEWAAYLGLGGAS